MSVDFVPLQNFEARGGPDYGRKNLPRLRTELEQAGLDAWIIPHEDEYQNEYLPNANERLMWVSGFSGSAGIAVVTLAQAAIFVDGRYRLQLRQQVEASLFSFEELENNGLCKWLAEHISSDQSVGYDPRLHTPAALAPLRKVIEKNGADLRAITPNPIDIAWQNRPPQPCTPLYIHPLEYAGQDHADKRDAIAKTLKNNVCDSALITAPASLAWLLNIRGNDVKCTPLALASALIHETGIVDLFIHPKKLSTPVKTHLGKNVRCHDETALEGALAQCQGRTIMVDPHTTSIWHVSQLTQAGARIIEAQDPVLRPKACKNPIELSGTKNAHRRDGAALVAFLYWLDTEAQKGTYDEIDAALVLEALRHKTGQLKDLSFETISGAGANGAYCHYRVSRTTAKSLAPESLYLVDSGGQYMDGTTDVTRTIPIGTPSADMCRHFTLVLKGHIALATARFPESTNGSQLDAFARMALWKNGLDYDHGTGHGVGVFLGVHEGPQRISKQSASEPLRPGMIVSNEPGYYKTGHYGIRIENLQYVTEPTEIKGGERPMLGFETLTLAPIHKALIDYQLLSVQERNYLDQYHQQVLYELTPHIEKQVLREWLTRACAPLQA